MMENINPSEYKIEHIKTGEDIKIACFLDTEKGKLHIRLMKKIENQHGLPAHQFTSDLTIVSFPILPNEQKDELSVATKMPIEPEPDNQIKPNQNDSKAHLSPSDI